MGATPYKWPQNIQDSGEPTPGFLGKLNFIAKFLINPCDAPLSLYLELANEPAGNIVVGLTTLDPLDISKNIHQPKTLGGCRKKRKRFNRARSRIGLPAMDEMVADAVKSQRRTKPEVWKGKKALFLLGAGALERAAFNWYVADLITDNVYSWLSAIQSTRYCQAKEGGWVKWSGSFYNNIASWQGTTLPWIGFQANEWPGYVSIGGIHNAENGMDVVAGGKIRSTDQNGLSISIQLMENSGGGSKILDSEQIIIGPYQTDQWLLSGRMPRKGFCYIRCTSSGGSSFFHGGYFHGCGFGNGVSGGFRTVD